MEAATQLGQWKMFGKLKDRETIVEGLEKAPDAINMLFTGGNTGKLIVPSLIELRNRTTAVRFSFSLRRYASKTLRISASAPA